MAQEYGLVVDTSSLLSSGTERDETDDEICSFDLGPEPFDPTGQNRLPSVEWLDDHQQGLEPGGSEPKQEYYSTFKVMPHKISLLDMMRNNMEEGEAAPPQSPERAFTPTIGFAYDYAMGAPPEIQRITDAPRHSTPFPDPPTLSTRPRPTSQPSRPRASSVPPTPKPAKRMAIRYHPVTETITPPISPARAHAVDLKIDQETPSPIQKPGRSRGRGMWRAPQKIAPGVGTRSKTRQAELEQIEAKQAQAACAKWPPSPDPTMDIQRMTREVTLVRRTQRRAQRTTEDPTDIGSEPELTPASSGWTNDSTPRCVLHPSPSRCWWREGDLGPSEYGNAGAHSSA